jgi:hypothetical protein
MNTLSTSIPLVGLDIGKNVHVYGTYRAEDLEPIPPKNLIYGKN